MQIRGKVKHFFKTCQEKNLFFYQKNRIISDLPYKWHKIGTIYCHFIQMTTLLL